MGKALNDIDTRINDYLLDTGKDPKELLISKDKFQELKKEMEKVLMKEQDINQIMYRGVIIKEEL